MARDRSRGLLVAALCAGYFLVLLDVTVVNVALPQIGSGLHAGSTGLAWVVDGYAVPLAALLLVSGAIGDRCGHRRVVLLGYAGFGIASVGCAVAPTIAVLVAARAVQGIGAALMLPGTLALLVESARSENDRARLVGVWAAVGGAALPAGPVIGGLLVQAAGWRAVFWLAVPVIALALVPVARLPRPRRDVTGGTAADRVGAALLRMPRTARRGLAVACLVAGLMNLGALGGLFLLTQFLQHARGLSPLLAGLATLPAMLPLPLLGVPAGRLCARIGVWRTGALGLLGAAVGFAGIAASIASPGYAGLLCSLAVWGAGLGLLTPAIVSAALRAAPDTPGVASGASNTSRQLGGALGVAIFGALAGDAGTPAFASSSRALFLGAAVAFGLTAVLTYRRDRLPARREAARPGTVRAPSRG